MSGRVKEGEKRERDRERAMERGRDRDMEESELDHGQESGGRGRGELVTSPSYRPRQRSPLSPLSQRERMLSPMTGTALGTTAERMTAESVVPAVSAASGSTNAAAIQSPMLSPSPPAPAPSTSPNRGPMLTNQDDVEEKLKRMNETFLKSLEGIGKGGGSVRRRDKEKGKEKEVVERDAAAVTRRGVFLVTPYEGEVPSDSSEGGLLMPTSASPYPGGQQQQHPNHPTRIPSPITSSSTSHALGHELGRGRDVVRSTSTSTSTSASSEAVGGAASQGSEEVIGRMDFYHDGETGSGGPRRF